MLPPAACSFPGENARSWGALDEARPGQSSLSAGALSYRAWAQSWSSAYLGATGDIFADWNDGRFAENFDGFWFSLPDGQNLTVLIETEGDGFDIYSSPVKLNGKRTNLILRHDYKKDIVTILGIRDPLSEEGMAGRITSELNKGDVITPLYYAVAVEGDGERWAEGSEYVYNGYSALGFGILPDGEYLYNFTINDIYGGYYDTESISFTIKGDEILY